MIEIKHLAKTYNHSVQALKDVSLNINGGMFGLLGPNGAGKTTLMRIVAGLLTPSAGEVNIFGHDVSTQAGKQATKSLLGYLPQELGLYPNLTGREFLDYIGILKGITNARQRQAQIDELLELVRLQDKANLRLKTYSGGMKRRIGIAQALLGKPKLMIVDEPTVGLDPEERVRFRNLLSTMASRCTVILSTHIIEDIGYSCNDLAVISEGRVLFQGAPSELIQAAEGNVWQITSNGVAPNGNLTVISTLQTAAGVQYRVLGQPVGYDHAEPITPTLEDGYIWLMNQGENVELRM